MSLFYLATLDSTLLALPPYAYYLRWKQYTHGDPLQHLIYLPH